MNIEFAKVEHSKRLSEIALAASEELRGIDFNEEGWERFVNSNTTSEFEAKLSKSEFSIFCCVESNCIIGFLSLKDNEKIDQLFVAPEARSRGVASSLWQRAKKNAIENSASGMFWVRSSSVARAIANLKTREGGLRMVKEKTERISGDLLLPATLADHEEEKYLEETVCNLRYLVKNDKSALKNIHWALRYYLSHSLITNTGIGFTGKTVFCRFVDCFRGVARVAGHVRQRYLTLNCPQSFYRF